jgi:hypothetical protein
MYVVTPLENYWFASQLMLGTKNLTEHTGLSYHRVACSRYNEPSRDVLDKILTRFLTNIGNDTSDNTA